MIIALMTVAVVGCSSESSEPNNSGQTSGDGYEELNLKLSTSGTEHGVDAITARYFADLVEEETEGNIKIKVYPNTQLAGGSMPKSIELLIAGGNYELAVFSGSVLGNIDEKFLTHSVPFIFSSYDDASEKMDSTGGEYYSKLFEEKGLVYMGGLHNGLRQLTNNEQEIRSPEQMKNLKIRVPSGEVYMKTLKEFGADPIAMNWSEVFTALQQGTIDGHENGYQTIDSAKIHEVQKYITEWNWSYDGYWLMANTKDWAKFEPKTQEMLKEKAQEAVLYGREYLEETEKELKVQFQEEYGVTITELTPEELEKFKEAAQPVRDYFVEKFGDEASKAWGLIE
jgi:tripartite ATP-independent transporter DctP family solute receptor